MGKKKRKKLQGVNLEKIPQSSEMSGAVRGLYMWVGIFLAISVILRIIYFIQNKADNPLFYEPVNDAKVYFDWAQKLAAGQPTNQSVYYMAPLYPIIMAGVFKLFGVSIPAMIIFQHFVGLINLVLIFLIARKTFNDRIALIAMFLATFHMQYPFYEAKLMLPTLTIFFYLLSLYFLLLHEKEKPNISLSLVNGLIIGLAILQRPNLLLFVPFVILWFFMIHRQKLVQVVAMSVLLLIGIAIPIAPVTIHNYKASGEFILLTYNSGINFFYGANMDAAPTFTRRQAISDSIEQEEQKAKEIAQQALGHEPKPSEISTYWMKRGFEAIREDVPKFLKYEILKAYWSINTYEIPNNYNLPFERSKVSSLGLFFIPYGVVSLLGLLGIFLFPKKNYRAMLLLFYLATYFAGLVMFTVVGRFRVPLSIIFVCFAGYAITELIRLYRNSSIDLASSKRYLAAVLIIVLLGPLTLIPYRKAPNPASSYHTLGILALRKGEYNDAIKYFNLALETFPAYTEAYNNLGSCYKNLGDLDKAIEMYDKASETNPKYPESRFNAGLTYMQKNDYNKAIDKFQQALAINPNYFKAKMQLGFSLVQVGRVSEAIPILKELTQIDPKSPQNNYNLGVVLGMTNDYAGARQQFEIALQKKPDYKEARDALNKLPK